MSTKMSKFIFASKFFDIYSLKQTILVDYFSISLEFSLLESTKNGKTSGVIFCNILILSH